MIAIFGVLVATAIMPVGGSVTLGSSDVVATYTAPGLADIAPISGRAGEFIVSLEQSTIRLHFVGDGFRSYKLNSLTSLAAKKLHETVGEELDKQIATVNSRPGRYYRISETSNYGYKTIRYAIMHVTSSGWRSLGTKVSVSHQHCTWRWTSSVSAATHTKIFFYKGHAYLGVVLYSLGASGYTASVTVLRIPDRCGDGEAMNGRIKGDVTLFCFHHRPLACLVAGIARPAPPSSPVSG